MGRVSIEAAENATWDLLINVAEPEPRAEEPTLICLLEPEPKLLIAAPTSASAPFYLSKS